MEYANINIAEIRLDPDNPRIANILQDTKFSSVNEMNDYISTYLRGDTGNTENGPSCDELKKSIWHSEGIIEPIILQKKDDHYLCIEGNTRLSIYFYFSNEYPEDKKWHNIPSLVHKDLSSRQIDELRLQAHFVGKKEWTPYAKGRYVTQLVNSGTKLSDIKEIIGGSDNKVRANYYAFKVFTEDYEALFNSDEDNKFADKTKFSMFTLVGDGSKINTALESRGLNTKDFAQWVKDEKISSANDIRRFMDKVLLSDEVYKEFKKPNKTLQDVIPMLPSDQSLSTVPIEKASVSQLCDVLNDKLLKYRNRGALIEMVEREGKGVIDSVNLLNIELTSTIEIIDS